MHCVKRDGRTESPHAYAAVLRFGQAVKRSDAESKQCAISYDARLFKKIDIARENKNISGKP